MDQRLVKQRLVDQRLVNQRQVDQRLVDQRLVDERLGDQRLVDQRLVGRPAADWKSKDEGRQETLFFDCWHSPLETKRSQAGMRGCFFIVSSREQSAHIFWRCESER